MLDLAFIELLENHIKYLHIKKIELENNKYLFFNKKKYKIKITKIEEEIKYYENKLLEEYKKIEN